jgi:RHS repeat-associated protein
VAPSHTASPDRLTQTTSAYILHNGTPHRQTITTTFTTADGTGTLTTTSLSPLYQSPGTSTASTTTSGQTQSSSTATTIDKPNKTVTTTQTTTSNGTTLTTTSITVNGLLISSGQVKQGETVLIAPTTYTHDDLGRVTGITDPRTGAVTARTYNAVGQLLTQSEPVGRVTTYTYYPANHVNAGQLASVTDPIGRTTYTAYDTLGRTTAQWGATYPVSYAYNIWGQMTHLKTWRTNAPAGATADPATHPGGDLTTWTYEAATGLLLNKTHADGKGPAYTYTPSGQLLSREWARGIVTTYTHDTTGNLTGINYDDTTPDVTHTYDRLGRRLTTTDAAGTRTYAYNTTTGAQTSETYSNGLLNGITLASTYQNGQRTAYQVTLGETELHQSAATYNALGQMATTTSGGLTATYTRHSDGTLSGHTIKNAAAATLLQNTLTHDTANRLTKTEWKNGANTVLSSHTYILDAANQRTKATQADGSAWHYTYDTYGQVTSAVRKNPAAQTYPGLQQTYTYDHIGNRTQSGIGVPPVVLKEYTATALNQYTAVTNPGSLFVLGSATADTTVTVNNTATQRLGNWFAGTATADTTNGPAWLPVETKAVKPTGGQNNGPITKTQTGHLFLPSQTETPTYDDDGNLTSDGRWTITWNGENRMIAQETNPAAVGAGVPKQRLEHTYDSEGRRIRLVQQTWNATTSTWTTTTDTRYAYDAYNEIANWTIDPATSAILQTQSLHWGLDLSQTEQGAGGVGGLISITTSPLPLGEGQSEGHNTLLACYDGNGNITAYVSPLPVGEGEGVKLTAQYDYDAFGNQIQLLQSTAPLPTSYGFSTKPTDPITNWSYYTFRHYDPMKGRWTNRDPIEERGGFNLMAFVRNSGIKFIDYLGLSKNYDIIVTVVRKYEEYETLSDWSAIDSHCKCPEVKGKGLELKKGKYRLAKHPDYRYEYVDYPVPPGKYEADFTESSVTGINSQSKNYLEWVDDRTNEIGIANNQQEILYNEKLKEYENFSAIKKLVTKKPRKPTPLLPPKYPSFPKPGDLNYDHNFELFDTADFTGIRWHTGGTCESSRGCMIIGSQYVKNKYIVSLYEDLIGQKIDLHGYEYEDSAKKAVELGDLYKCVKQHLGKKPAVLFDYTN